MSGSWASEESGHAGLVTPVATYLSDAGYYCRDYRETLSVGEDTETYENTACRTGQGQWVWVR